jgi:hypothetical protein
MDPEQRENVLCVIQKGTFPFWIIANIFECEVKKVPFLTTLYSYVEKLFLLKFDDKYYVNKSKEFNVIIYNECIKDNIKYKQYESILENETNELEY